MLWVRIELTGGGWLFVGVIYMVPEGSVYVHEAEEAKEKLSAGLHYITVVLGDVVSFMGDWG